MSVLGMLNVVVAACLLYVAVRKVGKQQILASFLFVVGTGWLMLTAVGLWSLSTAVAQSTPPQASGPGNPCPTDEPSKTFDVSLINIPIFLNRFGDVVPEGRMYVLDENITEVRENFSDAADPFHIEDLVEPLVLRVNHEDCVEINFTNRLDEPAPDFNRDDSIFLLPGEALRPAGTITKDPREFQPARTQPDVDFDPANAPAASMHFDGLDYDVRGSDGAAVGNNPNSTAQPGATITYRLFADTEGEFQFKDAADLSSHAAGAGNNIGSTAFGAFGGIIVEPQGATWVDSHTGEPINSGTEAIIKDPNGPNFREHTLFMHDEVEAEPGILTRFCRPAADPPPEDGNECVNPTDDELEKLEDGRLPGLGEGDADALINGEVPVKLEWFAFNYRSEPAFNREEVDCPALRDRTAPFRAPACIGEETSLSSWPFGDPGGGDLVTHNYRNEPTVTRLFHGSEQETHTFHQHVNRWPTDPKDEGGVAEIAKPDFTTQVTNPIDVQAVSPGSHYTLVMKGGAGSPHNEDPGSVGDVIFHCHLYPHFAEGMWGLNRVHDVLEDGTRKNPDTTPIPPLEPVDESSAPPAPTTDQPGFPFFVPGEFGFKAPKPPLGVPSRQADGDFPPTDQEIAAAQPDAQKPGAFFVDYCPPDAPVKKFEVAAIQVPLEYNDDLGLNNPQARMYVLQENKDAILNGDMKPKPFAPLLNVGDCVEYHLTNELPDEYGGTVFDRLQETNEVSIHQHMVQFDVLSSDGAANGWNYDQGADGAEVAGDDNTIIYRNYVQAQVRTNSFHDHFFPNVHQDAGLFGGATIHPKGCEFRNPIPGNGKQTESATSVRVGTVVDVICPGDDDDYRSASMFIEDQVPLFLPEDPDNPNDDDFVTPEGVPLFPSKFPSSNDDRGGMGINYRSEHFEGRRDADPSKLFDSDTHDDPVTPIPRAFAGDTMRFNLFQLSMEESHGFNLDRFRWKFEPNDPESRLQQAQHIGMLEYFEFEVPITRESENPKDIELRDYLYYYGGADDWFNGAWGLFRVIGCDEPGSALADLNIDPLRALPDNEPRNCNPSTEPPEREIGNPCPTDADGNITAPIKQYDVTAFNQDITYNGAGDHDPNGVMYALNEDVQAIKSGDKDPEPLVIRANQGDCIEVTLTNQLDPDQMQPHCFEAIEPGQLATTAADTFPECIDEPPNDEVNVPGFQPFPVSSRVSFNPRGVNYHIGSDGAHVGFNFDSTVAPGDSITYRYYAPDEFGLGVIQDRADVQNHLHHGLYGGLIIEPPGSNYLDPSTGTQIDSGEQAVIEVPDGPDFRENATFMNSDLALFRENGEPVPDNVDLAVGPSQQADDPEDQGEFSINYRNEPFNHRFQNNDDLSLIFSSAVHGDPATPLFRAYSGDPVRFRVAQAVGDPRSTGFALHGHKWLRSPDDPQSEIAAFQGQFNPTVTYNVHLEPNVTGGAGGPNGFPGDYLYRSNTLIRHLPGGQWGIFRVFDQAQPDLIELPDKPL